ncbi:hydroxyisourate hydrolase [Streptomyces sp. NPDC058495]|uniref:hydroxyisourate hydrolase n=1 Tax=unclassified Streptomyces TaxID=2593676 RepID=UPI00365E6FCD
MSVSDGTNGRPVDGLLIRVERPRPDAWETVWQGLTGSDGRLDRPSLPDDPPGPFRLVLETERYFTTLGMRPFYSHIVVAFAAWESDQEIPIVIAPHGYAVSAVAP